jgi:hypothetical protein
VVALIVFIRRQCCRGSFGLLFIVSDAAVPQCRTIYSIQERTSGTQQFSY